MSKIAANDLRPGMLVEYNSALWRVVTSSHVHVSGRGGACMQIELRNIEDGGKLNQRFRTDEKIQRPQVDTRVLQYLYASGDSQVFMDTTSFEQTELPAALLDGATGYLLPEMEVTITEIEGRAVGIELPSSVDLEIASTEPHIKGATATSSYKPATMSTGITVMVPPFVTTGETIRVSTASGEYLERV